MYLIWIIIRSNIKVLRFLNDFFFFFSFWGLIHLPRTLGKTFGPCLAHYESFMQEYWNIIIFRLGFGVLFWVRKNCTAEFCIFSLWIVKSLQLYVCRQIVNPCKYCKKKIEKCVFKILFWSPTKSWNHESNPYCLIPISSMILTRCWCHINDGVNHPSI